MNISHPILLDYYKKYNSGSNNLIGGIPWYYYLWPGNWFKSKNTVSSTSMGSLDKNPLLKEKKNINLPSLVKLDVKLYNPSSKGGYSEDIIPIINIVYNLGNYNFKNNDPKSNVKIDFTIVKSMDKILYGAGTYTAVYKIKDNNSSINDPNVKDKIYILRLTTQDENTHMYDNPKIHKEYNLFNNYLPRIYYYGNFIASNNHIYYYTITKLYNDFSIKNEKLIIPKILTNADRFVFFYKNIVMLNDLYKHNYTHFDYKLVNVGFEIENNEINIILIDYDENTLQELSLNNNIFIVNDNQNVTLAYDMSSYVPSWLIDNDKQRVYNNFVPIEYFKKYCTIGLYNILYFVPIKFKINIYTITNLINYEQLKYKYMFNNFIRFNNLVDDDELHLNSSNYNIIPTYDLLLEILSPIIKDKKKYLL